MTHWLSRNAAPIALVLVAAGAVIGLFELIDALADSSPATSEDGGEALTGAASVAGLIKVAAFLGVGTLIAIPLRRRFERPGPDSS